MPLLPTLRKFCSVVIVETVEMRYRANPCRCRNGWHTSKLDNREHGTVDYERGESVERKHVYPR